MGDPRQTRAWRKLRDQVVAEEPTCWLRTPGTCTTVSTTADHVVPVSERADLAMSRANLRGACQPCNAKRGNSPAPGAQVTAGRPSALDIFG